MTTKRKKIKTYTVKEVFGKDMNNPVFKKEYEKEIKRLKRKKRVKKEKKCNPNAPCEKLIEIEVIDFGHDINIQDTVHSDNSVTMTRLEAKFVLKELKRILTPTHF